MTTPPQPVWYPNRGDAPEIATVTAQPKDDPFYSYTDPLHGIAPGTVLKTRNFRYHLFGFPTLLETTRAGLDWLTSQTGNPMVNVTSIIEATDPVRQDESYLIRVADDPQDRIPDRRTRFRAG